MAVKYPRIRYFVSPTKAPFMVWSTSRGGIRAAWIKTFQAGKGENIIVTYVDASGRRIPSAQRPIRWQNGIEVSAPGVHGDAITPKAYWVPQGL